MTNINLPEPECKRTGTGNIFNLIMRMTVHSVLRIVDKNTLSILYVYISEIMKLIKNRNARRIYQGTYKSSKHTRLKKKTNSNKHSTQIHVKLF